MRAIELRKIKLPSVLKIFFFKTSSIRGGELHTILPARSNFVSRRRACFVFQVNDDDDDTFSDPVGERSTTTAHDDDWIEWKRAAYT